MRKRSLVIIPIGIALLVVGRFTETPRAGGWGLGYVDLEPGTKLVDISAAAFMVLGFILFGIDFAHRRSGHS